MVPGFKLVHSKPGNRAWVDEKVAEETLKAFRIKGNPIYTQKLIIPPQTEKLLKSSSPSERRWKKLETLITHADGKPVVATDADLRPALDINSEKDFENVDAAEAATEFI